MAEKKKKVTTSRKKTAARPDYIKETADSFKELQSAVAPGEDFSGLLFDFLGQFRSRLFKILGVIIVLTGASVFFSADLVSFIGRPFADSGLKLNIFRLTDGFFLRLKVALVAGILVSFPYIVFQIWRSLRKRSELSREKGSWFVPMALVSGVLLFYAGVVLAYLSMPLVVKTLLGFAPQNMDNIIDASLYFSFMLVYCLAMGAVAELPVVILILTRMGIVTPQFLSSKRKYAIVIIWIAAAIITPTVDPFTQSLVAVPLMALFEVSIIISKLTVKRREG